ncbi:hypothetical protein BCR33DRAFT_786158 [Rhizoclosmatium globosum]|uniref:Uncharacterized protein n=1 Tax=Rhizoclosmatium globosum TaxID=329046 RepID=A0A1Y2C769_9FUNG|nr:hypothetical protein BCR33DRAFT_786150 [Rhizoclosmatium globosum]ORY42878.1 hypothetical protein BCR33DRAFT_786158 [Rhizoclosmatium globosum]|eukprot:ORY42858.1 hypothetical protein BCR33DRAFT_786150 [Rhizoclosmatium globosum]
MNLTEELETVKKKTNSKEQSQEMEEINQELSCEQERMESAGREMECAVCGAHGDADVRVAEAQKHALLAREDFERSQAKVSQRESDVSDLEVALAVMTKERDEVQSQVVADAQEALKVAEKRVENLKFEAQTVIIHELESRCSELTNSVAAAETWVEGC